MFNETRSSVSNRGKPPEAFLAELVEWGRVAPAEIFQRNERFDIYSAVVGEIGPWRDDLHRRAAMLEVLRVLGGFESSWKWQEGRDRTNPGSNTACTEEAGIFQCSGNSMNLSPELRRFVQERLGTTDCDVFRERTKSDHQFAFEYCARLLRVTTKHHGPIKRREINSWLRRDALEEFFGLLSA